MYTVIKQWSFHLTSGLTGLFFFLVVKSPSSYKILCCTSTEHFLSQCVLPIHSFICTIRTVHPTLSKQMWKHLQYDSFFFPPPAHKHLLCTPSAVTSRHPHLRGAVTLSQLENVNTCIALGSIVLCEASTVGSENKGPLRHPWSWSVHTTAWPDVDITNSRLGRI